MVNAATYEVRRAHPTYFGSGSTGATPSGSRWDIPSTGAAPDPPGCDAG